MTSPYFDTLIKHWESLRNGNEIPYRSQIDPRLMSEYLENIFIIESTAPEQYRIRHTGMLLCEMMGFEVRGLMASSVMQNSYREKMTILLGQVLARPGIAELTLVAQDLHDNVISLKMLLMPLRSDFGDVTRILGCISTPIVPYVAPLRFGVAGQKFTEVNTNTIAQRGFAEPQAAFGTDGIHEVSSNNNLEIGTTPRRGRLRLVSDNDQEA